MENDDLDIRSLFEELENSLDERIRELEIELEKEKDQRKEERFIWCLIFVIMLNIFVFTSMQQSVLGPLVIGVFEAFVLLLLAQKFGLEKVVIMVEWLIAKISRNQKN